VNATRMCHDTAEKLLIWHLTAIAHSHYST